MANKGQLSRPNRRAASNTHCFKYQLAGDPGRAEENDLKRALQESLLEQFSKNANKPSKQTKKSTNSTINSSSSSSSSSTNKRIKNNNNNNHSITNSNSTTPNFSEVSATSSNHDTSINNKTNKSSSSSNNSYSNRSATSITSANKTTKNNKRTRSSLNNNTNNNNHNLNKAQTPLNNLKKQRATKTNHNHNNIKVKNNNRHTSGTNTSSSGNNTTGSNDRNQRSASAILILTPTTGVSKPLPTNHTSPLINTNHNTTMAIKTYSRNSSNNNNNNINNHNNDIINDYNVIINNDIDAKQKNHINKPQKSSPIPNVGPKSSTPIKNTSPRTNDKDAMVVTNRDQTSKHSKGVQASCISQSTQSNSCPTSKDSHARTVEFSPLLHQDTMNLSNNSTNKKNHNQSTTNVKVINKRVPQGSWSLLGIPEERTIYMREDEPPRRLICYPAIKHIEGDVIQVRDSVLLRSGARKTDLPYIAKVCSFWEDAESGNVMMSLFWYYRPEHTEDGRKPHHLQDEIFASRHRDVDSVECIEDKCYVLTFNEYCRYRKRCKMEQVNTTWSLTDVTIPVSNEMYPRKSRIPDSDVNPELVFCCRQIYDSRLKRLVKNPLINPKYGHI